MTAATEYPEHPFRVTRILRLAEHDVVNDDDRIRTDDECFLVRSSQFFGFRPREALSIRLR